MTTTPPGDALHTRLPIPYTGIVKTAVHLTEEQVTVLLKFFEGVLDAIERTGGKVRLRDVPGAPMLAHQRNTLGRVWYKLMRVVQRSRGRTYIVDSSDELLLDQQA